MITLDGQIVVEAGNRLLSEGYQPRRHAEQEALASVPIALWPRAKEMTCYTTLEPCLMCFGSLLLCGVGRVVFGAVDVQGGARFVFDALPPFYAEGRGVPAWVGPVLPEACDPLYQVGIGRGSELIVGAARPALDLIRPRKSQHIVEGSAVSTHMG